jgi:quercetin dioxygenase-like cupin family protein
MTEPVIVRPGELAGLSFMPGELLTWLAAAQQTNGVFDFGELRADPGVKTPEHIHGGHDETFYLLDGSFRFKVGSQIIDATAGTFVFIPRGTPHTWISLGSTKAHTLLMFMPGGMDGFFRELGPLLPELMANMGDLSGVAPETLAKTEDIFRRYQYELVGPPLD